mmetsp:Transcript_6083/g.24227  ORF Transcript_6083/g.24227 Transcript_6083/m.24227 type:complete len:244 (-) Transcript_6083:2143-2874(-)
MGVHFWPVGSQLAALRMRGMRSPPSRSSGAAVVTVAFATCAPRRRSPGGTSFRPRPWAQMNASKASKPLLPFAARNLDKTRPHAGEASMSVAASTLAFCPTLASPIFPPICNPISASVAQSYHAPAVAWRATTRRFQMPPGAPFDSTFTSTVSPTVTSWNPLSSSSGALGGTGRTLTKAVCIGEEACDSFTWALAYLPRPSLDRGFTNVAGSQNSSPEPGCSVSALTSQASPSDKEHRTYVLL